MNNQRRKRIAAVEEVLLDAVQELQLIAEDEQDAYDNLPQSFQFAEKGERMLENISTLEDIMAEVDSQKDVLTNFLVDTL